MDQTQDDLNEEFVCSTIADVEELQAELETFKAGELQEGATRYDGLDALVQQAHDLGGVDNPYTTLTPQVGCLQVGFI